MKDICSEGHDVDAAVEADNTTASKLGGRGVRAVQGDTDTPTKFGTFAHEAYGYAAEDKYGDAADIERRVGTTKPDGSLAEGEVDLAVGNALIDYKTCDMRDWSTTEARVAARKHGQQMKEYVDSPDTPADAKGWIVATVPPDSQIVRDAYAAVLSEYNIGVKFAKGEDQASVMKAVDKAVKDTP